LGMWQEMHWVVAFTGHDVADGRPFRSSAREDGGVLSRSETIPWQPRHFAS
jgi:hypothetical protein